jgi:hypothetical protein
MFWKKLTKKPFERVAPHFQISHCGEISHTKKNAASKHHKPPMFKLNEGVRVKVFFQSFHVAPKVVISHKKIKEVENLEILLNVGQPLGFTS